MFVRRLRIKIAGPDQPVRDLSGGNQQKVLLARMLCLHPRVLLLDEPTRGIDVGAKAEIQALVDELAAAGLGVVLISSDLEEVVEGATRVLVLRDGAVVGVLTGDEIGEHQIMTAIAGRRPRRPARPPMPRAARSAAVLRRISDHGVYVAIVALLGYNLLFTANFATVANLRLQLVQVVPIAIVALGMALVVATEGIDLSVGSVMALSAAVLPLYLGYGPWPAIADRAGGRRARRASSTARRWPSSASSRSSPRSRCWWPGGRWRWCWPTGGWSRSSIPRSGWIGNGSAAGVPVTLLVTAALAVVVAVLVRRAALRPPGGRDRRQPDRGHHGRAARSAAPCWPSTCSPGCSRRWPAWSTPPGWAPATRRSSGCSSS